MSDGFSSRAPLVPKWLTRAIAPAMALALQLAPNARAEVIEIAKDGQTTRIDGPAIVTEAGISPLAAPPAHAVRSGLPAGDLAAAGQAAALSPRLVEAVAWAES